MSKRKTRGRSARFWKSEEDLRFPSLEEMTYHSVAGYLVPKIHSQIKHIIVNMKVLQELHDTLHEKNSLSCVAEVLATLDEAIADENIDKETRENVAKIRSNITDLELKIKYDAVHDVVTSLEDLKLRAPKLTGDIIAKSQPIAGSLAAPSGSSSAQRPRRSPRTPKVDDLSGDNSDDSGEDASEEDARALRAARKVTPHKDQKMRKPSTPQQKLFSVEDLFNFLSKSMVATDSASASASASDNK